MIYKIKSHIWVSSNICGGKYIFEEENFLSSYFLIADEII